MTDSARRRRLRSGVSAAAIAALALAEASTALAGPQGGQIRGGAGTISQDGGVTRIRQTSDRLVIDWDSFDIEAGETVRFRQPGRDAVALNRVTGEAPTAISGALEANGNVWIVNRSGVSFNRGARVDVGGLLATTADTSDEDFLAGRNRFDRPGQPRAMVTNEGAITVSEAGLAALVGPRAANRGRIEATLGTVVIGGAERFALDLAGDGMFAFALDGAALSAAGGPLAENAGEIAAAGGRVLISAEAAADLVDAAVSVSGRVEAGTGSIRIEAGAGLARIDGRLTALGAVAGETGGTVEATGGGVIVGGGATLDASGDAGGGAVRVGGMLRGGEGLAPARRVRVAAGATLRASATGAAGAGGEAIVWAEEATWFSGHVETRGGAEAGDGGFAEVSGKGWLDFRGTADLSAPGGAAGTLLLDPANIVIAAAGAALPGDGTVAFGDAGLDAPADPTTSTISAASLASGPTNVILQATNDITVNAAVTAAGRNLTFEAGNNIALNSQVSAQSVNFEAGRNLTAGADVTTVGALTLRADAAVNGAAANGVGALDLGSARLAGGAVTLSGAGALELGAIDAASLSVTAGGAVTQAAAATVTGTTTVTAAGETVTLANAANDFGGAVAVTGGAVTLRDANALALGAIDAASLSVTAGGAVTQTAAATVSGATTVTAAGQTVTLEAANDFGTNVNLTGSAVTIRDAGDLALGTVTATQSASVTADNAGSDGAFGGGLTALSFSDTAGDMGLGGFSVAGGTLATLSADAGGTINVGALALGGVATTLTATGGVAFGGASAFGSLAATAGGAVTQTGALTVSGATTVTATGRTVTLGLANDFGTSVDLTGSAVAIRDAGNLALGTVTATLSASVTADDAGSRGTFAGGLATLSFSDTDGAMTLGGFAAGAGLGALNATAEDGAMTVGALVFAGATATLEADGTVAFDGASSFRALEVEAEGAVTQAGALTVAETSRFEAGGDVTLGLLNQFAGAVSAEADDVTLTNGRALILGAVDADELTATASGTITQIAALEADGAASFTAAAGGAPRDVTLGLENEFRGEVDVTGAAVTLTDRTNLRLGDVTATAATIRADDAGASGRFAAGLVSLSFIDTLGDGRLGSALAFAGGATTIRAEAAGDLEVGDVALGGAAATLVAGDALAFEGRAAFGALTATAGGAIRQDEALSVAGATILTAGGDVLLGEGGNAFGGPVSVTAAGRAATLAAAGALEFGAVTAASLDAEAGGAITQTAALAISDGASFDSDGAIALTNAANAFGGDLSLDGAGSVEAAAAGDLRMTRLAVSGEGSTGTVTASGALSVPARISGVGTVALTAGGALDLTGRVRRGTDIALTAGGGLDVAAGGRLSASGAIRLSAGGAMTLAGQIADFAALTADGAAGLALSPGGEIRAGAGAVTLESGAGEVAIDGRIVFDDPDPDRRRAAATADRGSLTMESDGNLVIGGRFANGARRFLGGDDVLSGGADVTLRARGDVIIASFVGRGQPLGTLTVSAENLTILLPESVNGAPVRAHALAVERLVIEKAAVVKTVADETTNRAFEGSNEFFGISIADRDGLELPPEASDDRPDTINLTGRLGTAATREVATALGSQPAEDDYRFNTCSFGSSGECSTNTTVTFRAEVETRAPDIFALEVERLADVYAPFGNEELWRTPQVLTADGTARREGQE